MRKEASVVKTTNSGRPLTRSRVLCGLIVAIIIFAMIPLVSFAEESAGIAAPDLQAQINAAADNTEIEITIDTDVELSQPLVIPANKNITFVGSGTIKPSASFNNSSDPVIKVESGATLTIDGVTLDGNSEEVVLQKAFLYCSGTLNLKDGKIQNARSKSNDLYIRGIVYIDKGASFSMSGGSIEKNSFADGYYHGIVYVAGDLNGTRDDGGTFEMSGGTITNNSFKDDDDNQSASGAVYVYDGGNFLMSGGSITNHDVRGVCVGTLATDNEGPQAYFHMTGGLIANNSAVEAHKNDFSNWDVENWARSGWNYSRANGGGVEVSGGIFEMDGGTISNNYGDWGGGVSIYTGKEKGATFILNGGTISDNSALVGGGVFLYGSEPSESLGKENVLIKAGNITDNSAVAQGGGIYTCRGLTVQLEKVIVRDNDASVMGGGIWSCPTANMVTYVTNGGAIYHNDAGDATNQAGDDIASVPQEAGHETSFSERALGGGLATYYQDGNVVTTPLPGYGDNRNVLGRSDGSPRYDASDPGDPVVALDASDSDAYIAVKSVFENNTITLAENKATVLITGNIAMRGGGIGTNGNIIVGSEPDPNDPYGGEYVLNVTKQWAENYPAELAKEAEIALCVQFGGEEYVLDTVTLTEDEPTGSFTGLPAGDYYVKELDVPEKVTVAYTIDADTVASDQPVSLSADEPEKTVTVLNDAAEVPMVSVTATKVWDDENDKDGIRPESVEAVVLANGQETDKTLTLSEANSWTDSADVEQYDENGNEIVYALKEVSVEGYEASVIGDVESGFTITNKHTPTDDEQPDPVTPEPPSDPDEQDDKNNDPVKQDDNKSNPDKQDDKNNDPVKQDDNKSNPDKQDNIKADMRPEARPLASGEIPKTSDKSNSILWLVLTGASLALFGAAAYIRKRA